MTMPFDVCMFHSIKAMCSSLTFVDVLFDAQYRSTPIITLCCLLMGVTRTEIKLVASASQRLSKAAPVKAAVA